MSAPLTPSFRYPNVVPEGAVHPEVKGVIDSHSRSITDLNKAIVSLKSQMTTTASTPATTSPSASGGSSSTENVTINNITTSGGQVNKQMGVTAYNTSDADNGSLVVLASSSPVAVSLTAGVSPPWYCFFLSEGTGAVSLTPQQGQINGGATATIAGSGSYCIVFFDGFNFWACVLPASPASFVAVAHQFLTAYNSTTGMFSAAQPSFADISGQIATSQVPGISATITTRALTTGGTNGSMTYTNGLLTAQTPAT